MTHVTAEVTEAPTLKAYFTYLKSGYNVIFDREKDKWLITTDPDKYINWSRHKRFLFIPKKKGTPETISTVVYPQPQVFEGEDSAWFETMIFGGKYDGKQWRYKTLVEAKEGHEAAVRLIECNTMEQVE